MVLVQIQKHQNNYEAIVITGHANFKQLGQDIVCSAISAIIFGTLNALDQQTKDSMLLDVQQNKVIIKVLKTNEINQIVLKTMIYQLQTIEQQYAKNLQIKEI